jgi:hypothetical protein
LRSKFLAADVALWRQDRVDVLWAKTGIVEGGQAGFKDQMGGINGVASVMGGFPYTNYRTGLGKSCVLRDHEAPLPARVRLIASY